MNLRRMISKNNHRSVNRARRKYRETDFDGVVSGLSGLWRALYQWGRYFECAISRCAHLEPLPYDIEVKLKVEGRSETQNGWTEIIDSTRSHDMERGSLFSGKPVTFRFYSRVEPDPNGVQESLGMPWEKALTTSDQFTLSQ